MREGNRWKRQKHCEKVVSVGCDGISGSGRASWLITDTAMQRTWNVRKASRVYGKRTLKKSQCTKAMWSLAMWHTGHMTRWWIPTLVRKRKQSPEQRKKGCIQAVKKWCRKLFIHKLYLFNPSRPCRVASYGDISNCLTNLRKTYSLMWFGYISTVFSKCLYVGKLVSSAVMWEVTNPFRRGTFRLLRLLGDMLLEETR